jgi:hypothetical protein
MLPIRNLLITVTLPSKHATILSRAGVTVDRVWIDAPTSAEVKKMWIYTSTLIRLHGVVLN